MAIQVVVLAAGQGKRMHSSLPKVLHRLADIPLLQHVITTAQRINTESAPIIIHGHASKQITDTFAAENVRWVTQEKQLGTGHAVMQALPHLNAGDRVLILYGDVPLISPETLHKLIAATPSHGLGMLTVSLNNPAGYGRIRRNAAGDIVGVVEEKDATESELKQHEINPGIYLCPAEKLQAWLPQLKNKNAQQEYYLTDIISQAVLDQVPITAIQPEAVEEVLGVNDRMQLAQLERFYQLRQAKRLMQQGVTLIDPARIDIRGEVIIEQDVTIDVNVILEGHVRIGSGTRIGPNSYIRHSTIGEQVEVKANSVIDGAEIEKEAVIGPFARLRPGTYVAEGAHIGNFVEVKNAHVGKSSKINHLSYIGDAEIGSKVNIGAGTITCNYDGVNKYKTIIGDGAFIGSDTQLVAPVTVGVGATIGAGTTVTEDAPANQLTLSRTRQFTIATWQRKTQT